jgi:hypothetical protein
MAARRVSTRLTGVAVSMLLLAGLGCSLCPFVPQPATATPLPPPLPTEPPVPEPTPFPEPTPTPGTSVEMELFTHSIAGFSVRYPAGWVYQTEDQGAFFSESEEALEAEELAQAPMFAVLAGVPEDVEYEFGTVATAQDLLDAVLEGVCGDDCKTGLSEPWTFGRTPGVGAEASWQDTMSAVRIRSYVFAAVSDEVAGVGLGASSEDNWASYEPIFLDMIASLEFFQPELPEPVERGVIEPGETVEGTLHIGAEEVWTFDVREGQYVTIWLDAVVQEDLDTILEVYDSGGDIVVEDDDGGVGTNSLIYEFRVDVSGAYAAHASSYSGAGDYRMGLEVADAPSGGGVIGYGETVMGTMRGGGEHEWEFSGKEGDEVSIAMSVVEGGLDCYLELYSPDQDLLTYDDDSGGSLDALIEYFVLPVDGPYRIVASEISGEPGEYELVLKMAQLEIEGQLAPGRAVAALLEPGSRHHWLFEGESGDVVSISMVAVDKDMDTFLELFAPNGEQVATDDDSGGDSDAAILEFELPYTGTYRVVARGYGAVDTGYYELVLTRP